MLGDDDHDVIENEPIAADDLFGNDDIVPPLSPDQNEQNNEDGEPNQTVQANATTPAPKKHRNVNRLPNLNAKWLINHKEDLGKVNGYFHKIKFKHGKGQEKENLKLILRRYEYYAQQCYPKLCFTDFIEKVEFLSGKKTIKNALQDIRSGRKDDDDKNDKDENIGVDNEEEDLNIQTNELPDEHSHSQANVDQSIQPSLQETVSNTSPKMTDEIREMIRRKREEAIAKRKQKLDQSTNSSQMSLPDDTTSSDKTETSDNNQQIQNESNTDTVTVSSKNDKSEMLTQQRTDFREIDDDMQEETKEIVSSNKVDNENTSEELKIQIEESKEESNLEKDAHIEIDNEEPKPTTSQHISQENVEGEPTNTQNTETMKALDTEMTIEPETNEKTTNIIEGESVQNAGAEKSDDLQPMETDS